MKIKKLLNFSTHAGDPQLFNDDWQKVSAFVHNQGFDGLELLPVGNYSFEKIPKELIQGLHLRFLVFLEHIWKENRKGLLKMFGSMENVQRFYGGTTRKWIQDLYTQQFNLAHTLDCSYVVFHPVQCNLENIYDWQFPWHWQETLDMCAEILNESLAQSSFSGMLLFENLWWPGSFTMQNAQEYDYLRNQIKYDNCGIVLDTGHLLNCSNGRNIDEYAAIEYLLTQVQQMGSLVQEIHTIHLTCSLSGNYIMQSRQAVQPNIHGDFWQQLAAARKHVGRIDPHNPFTNPAIGRLFELIEPGHVVFEFTFTDLEVWQGKISTQKKALETVLW